MIEEQKNFGLSSIQLQTLLDHCLKPEEIDGDKVTQAKRVQELMHWFARLVTGDANPKWLYGHACELAYYIATTDDRAPINIQAIEMTSYLKGTQITDVERRTLAHLNLIKEEIDQKHKEKKTYEATPMRYVEDVPESDDDWCIIADGGVIASGLKKSDAQYMALACNKFYEEKNV